MHVAISAWFWDRPDTGSGQYVRQLVEAFVGTSGDSPRPPAAPDVQVTLIAPQGWDITPPPGVRVQYAGISGKGNWTKLRFEQALFPQMAAHAGADLAHVPYWGSPLNSPIPVVVTIHDLIPLILPAYRGGILARLYTGAVGAAARGAAAVITDSRASGEDIARHLHVSTDHIYPISLAASSLYQPRQGSLVDMAIRKKYKLPAEYVLYLGGYDIRKNVHTLLKAFTYVRKGYDIPLVLAGRLPEKKSSRFIDVSYYIDLMELGDIVQVVGEIEEDDKPAIYRMAKTFVFPSRYEGFGLPVLEAMACGKAVVTTNAASLPELVGDAAFVVDPDDARHMAGSILATLTQPDTNEDLSSKALARASEFSWARTAAETRAVYSQILSTS